jgi:formate dehydrogenase alpha subunit
MVTLTIDGRDVTVAAGTTILEAARQLGITIPTLCWLQKVSPTGACRVCAVEVEGVDRTMTACNTPVKEGIKVTTQSERLTVTRKKIMELMLVNHPLDCPVCDAAGECDLQDTCYGLQVAKQEYSAVLERRPIRYDWKLLESDPNRCILCEKCVKVDHEIVGCDAIAVVNKGEATIIDTVDGKPLDCDFCGNCIAACPTGTLISKPFKFRGRPWTFRTAPSVCAFCSVGCQIDYHVRDGRVERVTSDDTTFNVGNLCINGRFGYSYLNSADRLKSPLLKDAAGTQSPVTWDGALTAVSDRLKAIIAANGAGAVAGIGSPRITNEESFLFQKFLREAVGTPHIDSEARCGYAPAQRIMMAQLGIYGASATIDRIDTAQAVIVLGSDLKAEATGLEYRVIKAATKNNAKLILATNRGVKLNKYANSSLEYAPGAEVALLNGLLKALLEAGAAGGETLAAGLTASVADYATLAGVGESQLREAAGLILASKTVAILYGADIMRSVAAADAVAAVANLALVTGCLGKDAGGLFPVDEKNNTQGMLDMGVAPNLLPGGKPAATVGKDLWQILEGMEKGEIKALYLVGSDPVTSFPAASRFRKALEKLDLLVVQDILMTPTARLAHLVLPGAAAAEKEGTFTTPDHRVQPLTRAIEPPGSARSDLVIFSDLLSRFLGGAAVANAAAVMSEIEPVTGGLYRAGGKQAPTANTAAVCVPPAAAAAPATGSKLLVSTSLYHNGTTTAFSENNLTVAATGYVALHASDAARLGLVEGAAVKLTSSAGSITAHARISDGAAAGLCVVPGNFRDLPAAALLPTAANLVAVTVEKG